MCELLGLSARLPARLTLSMDALARRGGLTARHADGWGVAYVDGRDASLFRNAEPAFRSELMHFLRRRAPASRTVLAHVRLATRGGVCLANTQPFTREIAGRRHLFAHNGHLPGIARTPPAGADRPVGDSDSERAFCLLATEMRGLRGEVGEIPPLEARRARVGRFAATLRALGPANFLYWDGDALFAHGHRRTQEDGDVRPPGLWMLHRSCVAAHDDGEAFDLDAGSSGRQEVTLLASVPLTGEPWKPLAEGELVVVREGRVVPG